MKIVLTGSLGRIGRPLAKLLVKRGHMVTVISSRAERKKDIEAIGATAAIGSMEDVEFLTTTFEGANAVYLMIAWDAIGSIFDKEIDFPSGFRSIASKYMQAVEQSKVKKVIFLSSIGAHTDKGIGSLSVYKGVENIMNQLASDVSIKFVRPVSFYTNLYRFLQSIKTDGAIVQAYGGDTKEPWVSPLDIANTIVEEMEKPFEGRSFRYIASDEVSPNEVAEILGKAIGNQDLVWKITQPKELMNRLLAAEMNEWAAKGFIEMQAAQGNGTLYEDFFQNKPILGRTKLTKFAEEFSSVYHG